MEKNKKNKKSKELLSGDCKKCGASPGEKEDASFKPAYVPGDDRTADLIQFKCTRCGATWEVESLDDAF